MSRHSCTFFRTRNTPACREQLLHSVAQGLSAHLGWPLGVEAVQVSRRGVRNPRVEGAQLRLTRVARRAAAAHVHRRRQWTLHASRRALTASGISSGLIGLGAGTQWHDDHGH